MARTMAEAVVLRDPGSGTPVALLPGQECPQWAAVLITNEAVFEAETKPAPKSRAARKP